MGKWRFELWPSLLCCLSRDLALLATGFSGAKDILTALENTSLFFFFSVLCVRVYVCVCVFFFLISSLSLLSHILPPFLLPSWQFVAMETGYTVGVISTKTKRGGEEC
jgi:hypothetical protein